MRCYLHTYRLGLSYFDEKKKDHQHNQLNLSSRIVLLWPAYAATVPLTVVLLHDKLRLLPHEADCEILASCSLALKYWIANMLKNISHMRAHIFGAYLAQNVGLQEEWRRTFWASSDRPLSFFAPFVKVNLRVNLRAWTKLRINLRIRFILTIYIYIYLWSHTWCLREILLWTAILYINVGLRNQTIPFPIP